MKSERGAEPVARHEPALGEHRKDSYRDGAKMAGAETCPSCGASYLKGRWTWAAPPAGAVQRTCPACRRIADDFPAGYVTLSGGFIAQHRGEILDIIGAREAHAKREHPLQRIIAVKDAAGTIVVTTTDTHLARAIAEALHGAFKGELDLQYGKDENLLRARWSR